MGGAAKPDKLPDVERANNSLPKERLLLGTTLERGERVASPIIQGCIVASLAPRKITAALSSSLLPRITTEKTHQIIRVTTKYPLS